MGIKSAMNKETILTKIKDTISTGKFRRGVAMGALALASTFCAYETLVTATTQNNDNGRLTLETVGFGILTGISMRTKEEISWHTKPEDWE